MRCRGRRWGCLAAGSTRRSWCSPCAAACAMTSFQHDESAYPPCTNTMVGLTFGARSPAGAVAAVAASAPSGVASTAADAAKAAPAANSRRREMFSSIAPSFAWSGSCSVVCRTGSAADTEVEDRGAPHRIPATTRGARWLGSFPVRLRATPTAARRHRVAGCLLVGGFVWRSADSGSYRGLRTPCSRRREAG